MRNYGAYTLKTDYTKELAARILLAAAARSVPVSDRRHLASLPSVLFCTPYLSK